MNVTFHTMKAMAGFRHQSIDALAVQSHQSIGGQDDLGCSSCQEAPNNGRGQTAWGQGSLEPDPALVEYTLFATSGMGPAPLSLKAGTARTFSSENLHDLA
jgi:hypothetical protein